MQVEEYSDSIPITASESDLRIQVQTDPRYQAFVASDSVKEVLGYRMKVVSVDHVIQGKVWDCRDDTRRRSKTQKDLADSARIIEAFPELASKISQKARDRLLEKEEAPAHQPVRCTAADSQPMVMERITKKPLPLGGVYRLIEPGTVVLLSTSLKGRANVMTLSWLTMMEFEHAAVEGEAGSVE